MKILAGIRGMCNSASIQQKRILHVALLVLVGSVVYSNSLNAPFVLDDSTISSLGRKNLLEHLLHGSSRPVADITFALNYRIHGLQVAGYHLTNIAIHLSTAIILYFIIASALSALRVSFAAKEGLAEERHLIDQYIPLAIALLFVSHPVQTQAVTYIIQRYTSLATFFYLLSVLSFIKARLTLDRSCLCRKTWLLAGGALVAGLLALGSKQIAVTLPFMLFLLELFLFRGRLINRKFFAVCGVLITIIVLVKWYGSSLDDLLFDLQHATSEDRYTSRTTYFLTQTRVIATYLRLLCLPFGQNLVRDSPLYTSLFSVPVAASLVLHIFLVAIAAILFRMSGKSFLSDYWLRGVFQRVASLGIFWFYLTMAVESSIFPIRDVIFEQRIYLPSAGFFMAITAITGLAVQGRQTGVKTAGTLLAVVSLLLGGMTFARNRVWNDSLTLWQDAVNKSPDKSLALANLASEYTVRNMPEKALPLFVHAMELNPGLYFKTEAGIGDVLKELNIYETRFTTGEEFILPEGGSPDYRYMSRWDSVMINNLGLAYEYLKEPEKAKKAYYKALSLNPVYDLAWYNLALLAVRLGDQRQVDEALEQLKIINPALARTVIR